VLILALMLQTSGCLGTPYGPLQKQHEQDGHAVGYSDRALDCGAGAVCYEVSYRTYARESDAGVLKLLERRINELCTAAGMEGWKPAGAAVKDDTHHSYDWGPYIHNNETQEIRCDMKSCWSVSVTQWRDAHAVIMCVHPDR
jgi:hypothetical protein